MSARIARGEIENLRYFVSPTGGAFSLEDVGRHDAFFDLRETLSWIEALPRMEAPILDGGHFLLETHAAVATRLIAEFLIRTA
ncbi:hypothetical protein FHX08_000882 [Rhizobium sp. BK529]|uniref:hypothetical protein n=1 Tax=unclassified Rhizobium TaxID=2613769 RepID=UPI00182CC520|nr:MULTISPECIES: hypothetical protein [unclassified Rhizobium]MBB3590538.1 hypothetical protein [Rhizobium sp. BK529]